MEASAAVHETSPEGGEDARAIPVDVVIDDTTDDAGRAVEESRIGATAGLGADLVPEGGQTLVIGEDFYEDGGGDPSLYSGEVDTLSVAIGHDGYMQDHRPSDCFQKFGDGTWTEPEKFDRYYFQVPVLIDILRTDSEEERKFEREARRMLFKRAWAEKSGVEYLVLNSSDLRDTGSAKRAVAAARGQVEQTTKPAARKAGSGARARTGKGRGKVQRPRAKG